MDLVEVDDVDAQAREAHLDLAQERVALEVVAHAVVAAVEQRGLGEDVRALGEALERAAHDLLGVPEPVDGRGVDPVDAELEAAAERGDGLVVVLGAPRMPPAGATDGPGPQPTPLIRMPVRPSSVVLKPVVVMDVNANIARPVRGKIAVKRPGPGYVPPSLAAARCASTRCSTR